MKSASLLRVGARSIAAREKSFQNLRIALCENLITEIHDFCEILSNKYCFMVKIAVFAKLFDGKKTRPRVKREKLRLGTISGVNRRLRSLLTKLDGKNVWARFRTPVGNLKAADSTIGESAALILKQLQRDICTVLEPTNVESFSTSQFHLYKTLRSSPQLLLCSLGWHFASKCDKLDCQTS